jgi:chemotaxis protein methyltransferase CheR
MCDGEYSLIANLMFERSGVFLDKQKIPMIQARLTKRLSELGLRDFQQYCSLLRRDDREITEFINALTTHKTDFFREPEHFEILRRHILPEWIRSSKSHQVRIWSAACSSGEEVYTLAMVLREHFMSDPMLMNWDYKIVGTDIDTNVVAKATAGVYTREVVSPVRPDLLQKYFMRGTGANNGKYRVRDELRNIVKFRQHNLLHELGAFGQVKFQAIFLRNVLIYFKEETREYVIGKLCEALVDGGYLFVGHSESLNGIKHSFRLMRSAIYRKE